jgi:hypothetical protein
MLESEERSKEYWWWGKLKGKNELHKKNSCKPNTTSSTDLQKSWVQMNMHAQPQHHQLLSSRDQRAGTHS